MLASKYGIPTYDGSSPEYHNSVQCYKITLKKEKENQIQTRDEQHISLFVLASLMSCFVFLLIDIVKPVNNVEERKDSWKDHP